MDPRTHARFSHVQAAMLAVVRLGLLASTHAAPQQQAMMSAAFFIMPMIVLSGFAFPIRNMPDVLQWASWADPLRFYLVVIRDLFLKGGGPFGHPLEYAMMALLGISALALAVHRVR